MSIQTETRHSLLQLSALLKQISREEYSSCPDILSGASIGKHVRHILEFYQCLLEGLPFSLINYNLRRRNEVIEQDPAVAIALIDEFIAFVAEQKMDRPLQMVVNYSTDSEQESRIDSYLFRELAHNLEHAVHHMAIIKMAVVSGFPHLILDPHFGIAQSTIRYQQSLRT